jgi:hypothetical protein
MMEYVTFEFVSSGKKTIVHQISGTRRVGTSVIDADKAKSFKEFIEHNYKTPNLKIIDRAIELLETDPRRQQCCLALWDAFREEYKRCFGDHAGSFDCISIMEDLYSNQLREMFGNSSWWNGKRNPENKARRLAALKKFRKACVLAAKKAP